MSVYLRSSWGSEDFKYIEVKNDDNMGNQGWSEMGKVNGKGKKTFLE